MTFGSVFGRTFSPTFQPKSQAGGVVGGTATFNAVADTTIRRASATYNYGASVTLYSHNAYNGSSLHRFNLSTIPASATCTAAKLAVTASAIYYGATGRKFIIYQIASANGDWVEGTADGAEETGSPCYSYKAFHASTPTNWAGSAGLSSPGTDYVNTIIGELEVTDTVAANTTVEIPFNASGLAVIKSWFGESTNSGILLRFAVASNIHSREASTESYRPTLTVTYE